MRKMSFYTKYFRPAIKVTGLLLIILVSNTQQSKAQLDPMSSIYFQNQYLVNPAMAGQDQILKLNLGFRKLAGSTPGTPVSQSFTGDYGLSDKVGLGVKIYNDKAGLLQRTSAMGTYAYHIPLGADNQKLSFGLSMGIMNERIDNAEVNGDAGDEVIGRFNQREIFVDGDFGGAYTSNGLTVQGALPNLKTYFKRDANTYTVDRSVFYTAISYKFYPDMSSSGLEVEPKVAFRGVKGYDNIVDMGANVAISNGALNVMAIYHSSQSATFGMGINYKNAFTFTGMYTTEMGQVSSISTGNFEVALSINISGRK